jgi:hypothetical protein
MLDGPAVSLRCKHPSVFAWFRAGRIFFYFIAASLSSISMPIYGSGLSGNHQRLTFLCKFLDNLSFMQNDPSTSSSYSFLL